MAGGFVQHLRELFGQHPFDEVFAANIREAIRENCSKVLVHVHNRQKAEERLEEAAKEAIVKAFQEEFPHAIRPMIVRPDWPYAECWITDDEALIRYSFSPETDQLMGGIAFEPIRIVVNRAPPGLMRRIIAGFKADRAAEAAPTGTPDGRPELKLTAPLKQPVTVAAKAAAPARAKPAQEPKPVARQGAKPIPPGMKR
jgi:hypothetical protein